MQTPKLSTTSVYRRLAQVLLSLVLLVVILYKWVSADLQATEVIQENTKTLIDKLVSHAAVQASHFITTNQQQNKQQSTQQEHKSLTPQLQRLLNDLSQDPHIEQAMVYDKYGTTIASSTGAISATERLKQQLFPPDAYTPINIENAIKTNQTLMVVHEVRKGDNLMGYLRVNYYHDLIVSPNTPTKRKMMEEVLLMVLLSAVMGFLLTRGFARFSRNTFRMNDSNSK